jgi:DNA-nicking Smr family endonuclease
MAGKKDADDPDLFRAVMHDVKPLKRRTPRAAPPPVSPSKPASVKNSTPEKSPIQHQAAPSPPPPARPKQSSIVHGDIDGLDRRTGQRFKRGQLPVEARLDLHGLTQVEAHRALDEFLSRQYMAGKRCVIVVTGKGVGKDGGGVLRSAVPRWLNESPNREKVLAFEYARQKDGGAGALYVLMKRRRMGG